MTILKLGVLDIPYSNGRTTTGDVAEILESRYGVMGHFWEMNKFKIIQEIETGIQGVLEAVLMGAPPPPDPFVAGTSQIEKMFQEFLSTKQMDHKVPGVPTAAALTGKSSRFKGKKNKGGARPSFIDTGMYEATFKAWVE